MSKRKQATCDSIIRWLHDNPQPVEAIMLQFSIGRQRFANLRCSQAWHDAEAALGMAVERPIREVDASGHVTYLYEATLSVNDGVTARGLLVAMRDTATRLDTIMSRNGIYEANEADPATEAMLRLMHNNNLTMVTTLKNNVTAMDQIVAMLEASAVSHTVTDAADAEA